MNYKKFLGATSAALLIVIAIAILVLTPGAWAVSKYKTLYKFTGGKDGGAPHGDLIFDKAGNLYGTTFGGGAYGYGTVFKLNATGTETVLYSFTGGTDGRGPRAGLIFDQAGNLYGTAGSVVFKLAPNPDGSWSESVLHSFSGTDGAGPYASLIFDQAGNLYGTTGWGGANGLGTVFELTPNSDGSWTESVLYSFCSLTPMCGDGERPFAGLILDQAGNLYGTTFAGGTRGHCSGRRCGVVFKLASNPDGSWSESVLHSFADRTD